MFKYKITDLENIYNMEPDNSTMTNKIFLQLKGRFNKKYIKNRLNAEKWHSFFKRLFGKVFYREDMDPKFIFLKLLFILAGSYNRVRMNTIKYEIDYQTVSFGNLPEEFNGFRILHLSDLHIEGVLDKGENLSKILSTLEYDLCVITGDYRFLTFGTFLPTIEKLKKIMGAVKCRYGAIGILGNHDSINMVPEMEAMGVRMLVNESIKLERGNDHIWIGGVDEPSFRLCSNISRTLKGIPEKDFIIFLAHSPDLLKTARKRNVDFYLCGHTHGGQLCLPGGIPIITKAKCKRRYALEAWDFKGMKGYTSRGAGASGLPVRLHCPPQVTIHTLSKEY